MKTEDINRSALLALAWVKRSFEATGNRGSAGWYEKLPIIKGKWSAAYPETTGYLIPTLLDYWRLTKDEDLKKLAISSADWLISLQLPNGAFPGGFVGMPTFPSVFNTGMILFGLKSVFDETSELRYLPSLKQAVGWLIDLLETDGSWRQAAFVPGFIPAYYTKVIWSILEADKVLNEPELVKKMEQALEFYGKKIAVDGFVTDSGFQLGEPALTHTLAYSLTGFLESSTLLGNDKIYRMALESCLALAIRIEKKGKLAGSYDQHWHGDFSFQCLTGNSQFAILFSNLYLREKESLFKKVAQKIFEPVAKAQNHCKHPDLRGGLPGSLPVWGSYQRFKYPNWGVKFFLDARNSLANL